jgi:hypothetical protein
MVFSGFRPFICSMANVRQLINNTVRVTSERKIKRRGLIHQLVDCDDDISKLLV